MKRKIIKFAKIMKLSQTVLLEKKVLIPPLFYIYYTAVVKEISEKYVEKRNEEISCRYAGNYKMNQLHYKNEYFEFVNELEFNSILYNTYIKMDIKDFYNSIDINKLIELLKNSIKINEKEQMALKEFILYIGKNNFPQIDGGIASSYLATVVYLDIIDNKFYKKIKDILETNSFKMIRYADDLYIFFENNNYDLKKIENKFSYEYNNIIHMYNLNLNMEKTHLNPSKDIFEDIKCISLEGEDILEEELDDKFKRKSLEQFFKELIKNTEKDGVNHKTYYDIIDKNFSNKKIKFYQNQIYNTIIFKDLEWFKDTHTYSNLIKIIEDNNDILIHDPKRLLAALLNMRSGTLIKKFLYNIYRKYEKHNWTVYESFLSMRYLLYRNFKNQKLLIILQSEDNALYEYIMSFIKNNWIDNIVKSELVKMDIKNKALEEKIVFIRFISIIEHKKQNYLSYQAYIKSFFDSVTSKLFYDKEGENKSYFNKKEIRFFYKNNYNIIKEEENLINKFCDRRNENPLCHSNIKTIRNKNMKKQIEEETSNIIKLLNKYCDK